MLIELRLVLKFKYVLPISLFAVSIALGSDSAYTILSGSISGDLARGIYRISGDVVVPSGSALSIEGGTLFAFDSAASFTVDGTLLCRGTPRGTVTFSGRAGQRWVGIRLGEKARADFRYCVISGAQQGLEINSGASASLEAVLFRDNKSGHLFYKSSQVTIAEGKYVSLNFSPEDGMFSALNSNVLESSEKKLAAPSVQLYRSPLFIGFGSVAVASAIGSVAGFTYGNIYYNKYRKATGTLSAATIDRYAERARNGRLLGIISAATCAAALAGVGVVLFF